MKREEFFKKLNNPLDNDELLEKILEAYYNDDSIYYEENKQTLKNAFGEDKCTEYTTPEKYYECTDGNEISAARASGRVGVEINQWYCRDFQDGAFYCRQY